MKRKDILISTLGLMTAAAYGVGCSTEEPTTIVPPIGGGTTEKPEEPESPDKPNEGGGSTIPTKMNVLFVALDDFRPEMGCYGVDDVKTPAFDEFAKGAIQFNRAYCNVSVSGASRASLLTGLYPTRSRFMWYDTWAEKQVPNTLTLPLHLRNNGYTTISYGKVFHHKTDYQDHWSESPERFTGGSYLLAENQAIASAEGAGPAYEAADVADDKYIDGNTAKNAVAKIEELAAAENPFFFAVGFVKPHLPFNAPKKYWDMYDPSTIPAAEFGQMPEDAPSQATFNFTELRSYYGVPDDVKTPIDDELARTLKHGYYACASYTDAQFGRLIKALEVNGLADNTIVVVWGDHGWALGEHSHWCKHTCFETSLRVPFFIKVPGLDGAQTEALTSHINIYPTLCDLLGLDTPAHVEGESIRSVLENPSMGGTTPQFGRYASGESIITDSYIYTEYIKSLTAPTYVSNMLYDQVADPNETKNLSNEKTYSDKVESLRDQLRTHTEKIN